MENLLSATNRVPSRLMPSAAAQVTTEDLDFLVELERFDAPYLREALLLRNTVKNEEEYEEVFTEFKKFVALNKFHPEGLPMVSSKVDQLWHQFILFTPQYFSFCARFLGRYLHHIPEDLAPAPDNLNEGRFFYEKYQSTFGELPCVWSSGENCSSCKALKCRS